MNTFEVQMNFYFIEHLARVLCDSHGGKWEARKHKRQVWRDRVFVVLAKEEERQLIERMHVLWHDVQAVQEPLCVIVGSISRHSQEFWRNHTNG